MSENQNKKRVGLVNRLVGESFGSGFRGDYGEVWSPFGFYEQMGRTDNLGRIIRVQLSGKNYVEAGRFERGTDGSDPDGSRLSVYPEFRSCAMVYSHRFYNHTGRLVDVSIIGSEKDNQETA